MNRKEDYNCPHILGKLLWGEKCALNFQKLLAIFILGREFKRGKVLTNVQDLVTVKEMLGTVLYLSPAPLFLQQEPKGPLL